MAVERNIIKAQIAGVSTFEYKPKEFDDAVSAPAKSFVEEDAFRSPDFKISELVARQAGISQLENEAQQDKINAQVLDRLKEVQEEAYQQGYQLGLVEGTEKAFQEAKANLAERVKAVESILKRMEVLKTALMNDNEGELIKLLFLTAKKLAMRDLEERREAVLEILKNVVRESQSDERVTVKLSKEDHEFLQAVQEKSGQRMESLERVKFVIDESIKPGGCWIETEYGSVNATVEERLERTWQTLQARIPQNRSESE